ncbi:B12-binding domain-containing radical SAM protein [bacterium]|nr:B12-binding domain-containing radical SAM protein [bacterium]
MKILLVSMPDTASCFDRVMKMPNLGLCSVAGSLPPDVDVKIIDFTLQNKRIGRQLEKLIHEYEPDLIGLSAMSFQFQTAMALAKIIRRVAPLTRIAVGGYHPTLLYREISESPDGLLLDFIVRAEGEPVFRDLVNRLKRGEEDFSEIAGLSFRKKDGEWIHNVEAPLVDVRKLPLPNREVRILKNFHYLKRSFDCSETTRGCTFPCTFCSITRMYGKTFREFPIERIIEDLTILKKKGTWGVFFVDDNMTLNVTRMKILCEEIIRHNLNTIDYLTQATVIGIASDPELAKLMGRAGFKFVFLGIESGNKRNLELFKKSHICAKTRQAVEYLQNNNIIVLGGFIVANPADGKEDVKAVFDYCLEIGVDHPIIQTLTPYPKTPMREELLKAGLVVNKDNFKRYNGFIANVRTEKLSIEEINRLMVVEGAKLYWHPKYLSRSRFWRYHGVGSIGLLYNNYLFIKSGLKGDLFLSSHTL